MVRTAPAVLHWDLDTHLSTCTCTCCIPDEIQCAASRMFLTEQDQFEVDAPIVRHPSVNIARAIGEGGKDASTSFTVICSNPSVMLQPEDAVAANQGLCSL